MKWNVQLIDQNEFTRPGTPLRAVRNVVWHYTANPGAGAQNHYTYFGKTLPQMNRYSISMYGKAEAEKQKLLRYASAHFFIDKNETLQIIPLDEMAYHANQANPYSIGVELCIEKDGSFHPNTIKQAIDLGVELCRIYPHMNPERDFLRHYDVTGKICPKPWVDDVKEWFRFRVKVDNALQNKVEGGNRVPEWETYQWKMFADGLDGLYKKSVKGELKHPAFSDYTWAEKAYKGELTVDEVTWLMGIIQMRQLGVDV